MRLLPSAGFTLRNAAPATVAMRLHSFPNLSLRNAALALACAFASTLVTSHALAEVQLDKIKLPPGFEITLLTDKVTNARAMTLGAKGTLFVGSMGANMVNAVSLDGNKVTQVRTIARGLDRPVGVAFRDGSLYVSSISRIIRYDEIESRLDDPLAGVVVKKDLPTEAHHGWKFIAFGPDGKLYVPVGAPCNICEPDPNRYANIGRMNPDGSDYEIVATGVRNSVGFAWHPVTKELWFTDNGRDMMGDEIPSDELNNAPKKA